jgi:hypothetical protein
VLDVAIRDHTSASRTLNARRNITPSASRRAVASAIRPIIRCASSANEPLALRPARGLVGVVVQERDDVVARYAGEAGHVHRSEHAQQPGDELWRERDDSVDRRFATALPQLRREAR